MGWSDSRKAVGAAGRDDVARQAAHSAQTTANAAKTEADQAKQIGLQARGNTSRNYDKIADIERDIVGINNSIEELEGGADVADWAQLENDDPIPEAKLVNAPPRADVTARQQVAALQPSVNSNSAAIRRLPIFASYAVSPPGFTGTDFPEFMAITLANKLIDKAIAGIRVVIDGISLAYVTGARIAPFNERTRLDDEDAGIGGVINIEIDATNQSLLKANRGAGAQYARVELQFQFSGESTGTRFDHRDYVHIGTNNNAYRYVAPHLVGSANFNIQATNRFVQGDAAINLPTHGWGCIHFGRPAAASTPVDFTHYRINFDQLQGVAARTNNSAANNKANSGVIYASAAAYLIGRTSTNRLLVASQDGSGRGNIPVEIWSF